MCTQQVGYSYICSHTTSPPKTHEYTPSSPPTQAAGQPTVLADTHPNPTRWDPGTSFRQGSLPHGSFRQGSLPHHMQQYFRTSSLQQRGNGGGGGGQAMDVGCSPVGSYMQVWWWCVCVCVCVLAVFAIYPLFCLYPPCFIPTLLFTHMFLHPTHLSPHISRTPISSHLTHTYLLTSHTHISSPPPQG